MVTGVAAGYVTGYVIALALCLVCAYACGSIPFAIVIGTRFYGIDVREHGSGNTGATNVLRVLGVKPGLICLLLDVLKGALAVILARAIMKVAAGIVEVAPDLGASILSTGWTYEFALLLAAIFAVLGHCISPWLSFKGGKGVACSLGVVLALMPPVAAGLVVVFVTVVFISRYVSLGSVTAAASLPFLILLFYPGNTLFLGFGIAIAVVVIFAHRFNIMRLIRGEERRFSVGHATPKSQSDSNQEGEENR